jgi:hypothetical protein
MVSVKITESLWPWVKWHSQGHKLTDHCRNWPYMSLWLQSYFQDIQSLPALRTLIWMLVISTLIRLSCTISRRVLSMSYIRGFFRVDQIYLLVSVNTFWLIRCGSHVAFSTPLGHLPHHIFMSDTSSHNIITLARRPVNYSPIDSPDWGEIWENLPRKTICCAEVKECEDVGPVDSARVD